MRYTSLFEPETEQASPAGSRVGAYIESQLRNLLDNIDAFGEEYEEVYSLRDVKTLIVEHALNLTARRILTRRTSRMWQLTNEEHSTMLYLLDALTACIDAPDKCERLIKIAEKGNRSRKFQSDLAGLKNAIHPDRSEKLVEAIASMRKSLT